MIASRLAMTVLSVAALQAPDEREDTLRPSISIGAAFGDPAEEFSRVRQVAVLGDSMILVASWGTHDLRLFSLSGRHLRTWGGEGSGPGEYGALDGLAVVDDSTTMAFDADQQRLDTWTTGGVLKRSARVRGPFRSNVRFFGRFADGSILLRATPVSERKKGLVERTAEYFRYRPDSGEAASMGRLPSGFGWVVRSGNGSTGYPAPLRPEASVAVGGESWWFATGSGREIRKYSADGRVLGEITLRAEPEPVTSAERQAFETEWLARFSESAQPRLRRFLAEATYPQHLPMITALVPAPGGGLWVGRYARHDQRYRTWHVLDAAGREIRKVALPRDFLLLHVTEDHAAGVLRDEFDVQHVQLFPLH